MKHDITDLITNEAIYNLTAERLISEGYRLHHTATKKGYIQRTAKSIIVKPYSGKFGTGYTIESPRWDTTRYHDIAYYVKG